MHCISFLGILSISTYGRLHAVFEPKLIYGSRALPLHCHATYGLDPSLNYNRETYSIFQQSHVNEISHLHHSYVNLDNRSTKIQFRHCCMSSYKWLLIFQLHQHNYDTGKALQALVKIINPKSVDKRWSDDDAVSYL